MIRYEHVFDIDSYGPNDGLKLRSAFDRVDLRTDYGQIRFHYIEKRSTSLKDSYVYNTPWTRGEDFVTHNLYS